MTVQLMLRDKVDTAPNQGRQAIRQGQTLSEQIISWREIDQKIDITFRPLLAASN